MVFRQPLPRERPLAQAAGPGGFVAHVGTNWDLRTDTFVESRIGLDIRFQCYEFSMVFIDRAREIGRKGTDDEFRFSLNLLGIGGPIRTTLGP